jgi:hypothetical protein
MVIDIAMAKAAAPPGATEVMKAVGEVGRLIAVGAAA